MATETSRDDLGLELFRRAIAERDDAAWQEIVENYRGLLVAQAGRQVIRHVVPEDDEFCVDRAFQRFWQAGATGRLTRLDDLASLLKYLKMCLASVVLDQARARRRQAWLSIEAVEPEAYASADPSGEVIRMIDRRELWAAVEQELPDRREQLVARLSFVGGLSPREIQARHPEKFRDIYDVYRTKRNMIERLRRSQALKNLLN